MVLTGNYRRGGVGVGWLQSSPQIGAAIDCEFALIGSLLTVLTIFSRLVRMVMILFPARPSRLKTISMPSARRKVWARRRRPASARGFSGQPVRHVKVLALIEAPPARRSSVALPVHMLCT